MFISRQLASVDKIETEANPATSIHSAPMHSPRRPDDLCAVPRSGASAQYEERRRGACIGVTASNACAMRIGRYTRCVNGKGRSQQPGQIGVRAQVFSGFARPCGCCALLAENCDLTPIQPTCPLTSRPLQAGLTFTCSRLTAHDFRKFSGR